MAHARAFFLSTLTVLLAGCPQMLVENAQMYADQAAAAAAACSASDVQRAAENAARSAASAAAMQEAYERARAQEQGHRDAAARHRADAAVFAHDAQVVQGRLAAIPATRERELRECRDECLGEPAECAQNAGEFPSCAAWAATGPEQQRLSREHAELLRRRDESLAAAERAEAEAEAAARAAAGHASNIRRFESMAAEQAAMAQELAFNGCAIAATPDMEVPEQAGTYQQDIFGAQGRGLPPIPVLGGGGGGGGVSCATLCDVAMCSGLFCPGGGIPCSASAPASCFACEANGCF